VLVIDFGISEQLLGKEDQTMRKIALFSDAESIEKLVKRSEEKV